MAVRQAEITAANIISEIEGRELFEEYYHEISAVIDADGADSIYLHYGIWDDTLYNLKKGRFWGWAKEMHDRFWQARHGQKSAVIKLNPKIMKRIAILTGGGDAPEMNAAIRVETRAGIDKGFEIVGVRAKAFAD